MKRNDSKLTLKSYDDIFKTDEQRAEDAKEKVTELPLEELFPFPEHPFRVLDDDAMRDTAESVRQYGVLVPAIVRPREDGGYEIVSGHRRHRAPASSRGSRRCPASSATWTTTQRRSSW